MDLVTSSLILKDTIGYGELSEIKRASDIATGATVAVKFTNVPKDSRNEVLERLCLQMELSHPAICSILRIIETPCNVVVVMEYVKGVDLMTYVAIKGKLGEDAVSNLLKQLLSALIYLHDKGIAICDLSPDNIMVIFDEKRAPIKLKILGFDHIQLENNSKTKTTQTPFFAAPEQILYKQSSKASDMWSLGAIAYMMVCGYPPFFESSDLELYSKVLAAEYQFQRPWWEAVSAPAQNFIRRLLVIDPNDRYTAKEAVDHYFVNPLSIANPQISESSTTLSRLSKTSGHSPKLKKESKVGKLKDSLNKFFVKLKVR
ncbi:Calcium/calmodulin-dependent protein kinase type 1D [Boothiomyces macroporosus]|uniref:Calcium/calmodulin-dependent protein kinase type 1D n=1 Tax=Boothiomyces macroporosus TaxID=261099 RepID=A0AAD5UKP8_9FUNG|nr:Calcium/calmodulin-dependent protein kinase type 1D [Boothiomyces macroporosus]